MDDYRDEISDSTEPLGLLSVGESITGTIDTRYDLDVFSVTLTAGQTYVFDLKGWAGGGGTLEDPNLDLYSANGEWLESNDDDGAGWDARIVFSPTVSGTYYLEASGWAVDEPSSYTLSATLVPDDYRDAISDTSSPLGELRIGILEQGTIEISGDTDVFGVTLSAGQTYVFDLKGWDGGGGTLEDPFLVLYSANGERLESNDDDGAGLDAKIVFSPTVSGTYYLEASDWSGDEPGSYTLSGTLVPDDYRDAISDTSSPLGELRIGILEQGTIEISGDTDVFAVTLSAGQFYAFGMQDDSSDEPLTYASVELYDASDAPLSEPGGISYVETNGVYYLKINDLGDSGSYLVGVLSVASDLIVGEAGADILLGWDGNDTLDAGAGNDVLSGDDGIDALYGRDGNDILYGVQDNDTIIGGAGADTMLGGAGNDIYVVSNAADVVQETTVLGGVTDAGGTDGVISSINHTLSEFVENLSLDGAGTINGYGNARANTIWGNAAANVVSGRDGNDTLYGGGGNDVLSGNDENDALYGQDGNDILYGFRNNDTLIGGAGADTMLGGAGNDIYVVSNAADVAQETAVLGGVTDAGGTDGVISSINHTLSEFVENLSLDGAGTINGYGNARANTIWGNAAANVVSGRDGDDTLYGGDGNDNIKANVGFDVVQGGGGNDVLDGGLQGDWIDGATGNDTLIGGASADSMFGGAGNDIYVVDNAGDLIQETTVPGGVTDAGGTDGVISAVGYTLSAFVENLWLGGAGTVNGYGNALANTILGNAAANVVSGGDGNDTLYGGDGNDTIKGGAGVDALHGGSGNDSLTGWIGNDIFVFDSALSAIANSDAISGFTSGADKIHLDDDVFSSFNAIISSTLSASQFYSEAGAVAARDADDRIVYNTATGALFYDPDGLGGVAPVQFAALEGASHPAITIGDFIIAA